MKRATKDVLYFETGPDNPVTLHVRPGEEFEVETQMNRGPWLDEHPNGDQLSQKLSDGQQPRETMFEQNWSIPWYLSAGVPSGNPSSGCIYVEGAEPGDVLLAHIGQIDLDPVGYTAYPSNNGTLPGWLGPNGVGAGHRVVEIRDGFIHWSDTLKLPVRPMIGCVGVAPARERVNNSWAGYWGGNFDAQEVTTGATVMLGVNVEGALLHIGDMHERAGEMQQALASYQTQFKVVEPLSQADPAYRRELAMALQNVGAAKYRLGRVEDAAEDYERSFELREALFGALERRGSLKDFREELMRHPDVRAAWLAARRKRSQARLEAFLAELGVQPSPDGVAS